MSVPRAIGMVQPATTPIVPWNAPTQAWSVHHRETPTAVRRSRVGGIRTAAAPTAVVYPQATGVMGWPQPWSDSMSSITLPPAPPQYPLAPVTTLMVRIKINILKSKNYFYLKIVYEHSMVIKKAV